VRQSLLTPPSVAAANGAALWYHLTDFPQGRFVLAKLKAKRRQWKARYHRWLASLLMPLSTAQARLSINKKNPLGILVDSSVLGHGVTHASGWVSTGTVKWGGQIDVDTGYLARVPVHAADNDGRTYNEVKYLASIAHLHRTGHIKLLSSAELFAEQFRQPAGRFRGYGWADFSVFKGVRFESVDGHHIDFNNPAQAQRDRIAACDDPFFKELLAVLGEGSSQDAWHVYTAEKHGLFAFLHMDFPLAEKIRQNKNKPVIRNLRTRVMLPSEFAAAFKILPVNTNLIGREEDQFFPLRDDLHMPDQRRHRPKKQSS
jgi:hypothetical protein